MAVLGGEVGQVIGGGEFSEVALTSVDGAELVEDGLDIFVESGGGFGYEAFLIDAYDLLDMIEPGELGDGVQLLDEDREEVEESGFGEDLLCACECVVAGLKIADRWAVLEVDQGAATNNVLEWSEAGLGEGNVGVKAWTPLAGDAGDFKRHELERISAGHDELADDSGVKASEGGFDEEGSEAVGFGDDYVAPSVKVFDDGLLDIGAELILPANGYGELGIFGSEAFHCGAGDANG